jgi:predicted ABC-type ATPase
MASPRDTIQAWIHHGPGWNQRGREELHRRASGARGRNPLFQPGRSRSGLAERRDRRDADRGQPNAWQQGVALLRSTIEQRGDLVYETTLGGNTVPSILESGGDQGLALNIWYIALESVELHIQRVREREARGGHGIPEHKIRQRYRDSPRRLLHLLPKVTALRLYDNSEVVADPTGEIPRPRLLLHMKHRRILYIVEGQASPAWALPILNAVLDLPA